MSFGRLRALGLGFSRMGAMSGSGSRPTAPVLALISVVGSTVSLFIDVDDTVAAGDTVTLQVQATGGDWSSLVVNTTHTITSGEDAANEIDLTLAGFSNGIYDSRARVHHNSDSAWSNTVAFTISVTPSGRLLWSTDQQLWSTDHLVWS